MKKIIIDTDLGHDPDDFFAICYLSAIGVKIDAIVLSPGDLDQIAFANFLVSASRPSPRWATGRPSISARCSSDGLARRCARLVSVLVPVS